MLTHGACGRSFHHSHCGGCHEAFATEGTFDAHRLGPKSKYPWTCLPSWVFPALGMSVDPHGSWAFGSADELAARLARRKEHMAKMRWGL